MATGVSRCRAACHQRAGESVGGVVELAVAQRAVRPCHCRAVGYARGNRGEPGVNALRCRGFRRAGAKRRGFVSQQHADLTQRSLPLLQQLPGGGQQPLAERGRGGVSDRAVDDFDHQDQFFVGHMRGEHDRKMGEALHRRGAEGDAGAGQLVTAGHATGREVFVNQQGVVHLADTAHRAQLRMTQVAVFAQDR